jgi:hypothetical protein
MWKTQLLTNKIINIVMNVVLKRAKTIRTRALEKAIAAYAKFGNINRIALNKIIK